MELNTTIEIVISVISLLLCISFFLVIRRNGENIFFSMRSSNLMQITNLSIFMSIFLYFINDKFYYGLYKEGIAPLIFSLYFIFQLVTFMSLILRYHRIYISCKTNSLGRDDLLQFRFFEAKTYHYEYFYVRIMMIFIIGVTAISILISYTVDNIMYNYELSCYKGFLDDKNHNFWTILSFIQTFVFMTYALLIIKTHLYPKVHLSIEIILVTFVHYLYFLSIGLSFIGSVKKEILIYIPLLYNLLLYFITLGLPFIWGRFNDSVINYDLPGELASSLYLFLTKERCFDAFRKYLSDHCLEKDKAIYFLDMLINIFKYRMLVFNEQDQDLIAIELNNIERMYLHNNYHYFDSKLINQMREECNTNRNNPKINAFDHITNVIYDYLEREFKNYIKTEEFDTLKNDLLHETYVRCKLANYGLIRN